MASDTISQYKALIDIDTKVTECCQAALNAVTLMRQIPNLLRPGAHKRPFSSDELIQRASLVGSAAEGVILPRMFGAKTDKVEGDVMLKIADLDTKEAGLALVGKAGIYKVNKGKFFEVLPEVVRDKYEDVLRDERYVSKIQETSKEYLSGLHVKSIAEAVLAYRDEDNVVQKIAPKILRKDDKYQIDSRIEFHGPSANVILDLKAGVEHMLEVSVDFVLYVQLNFWPQEASDWVKRKRHWPPEGSQLITMATQCGCQMVAKPQKSYSRDVQGHSVPLPSDENEWRLTFTKAENLLARSRSPEMKLVYMIAKSVFYKHLNLEAAHSKASSYWIKTTMMWLLETTPHEMWTFGNVIPMVETLFKNLQGSLQRNNLPYYFIPEINLLAEYPCELLEKVLSVTDNIVKDIPSHIPGPAIVEGVCLRASFVVSKWQETINLLIQHNIEDRLIREQGRRGEHEVERCTSVKARCYEDTDDLD